MKYRPLIISASIICITVFVVKSIRVDPDPSPKAVSQNVSVIDGAKSPTRQEQRALASDGSALAERRQEEVAHWDRAPRPFEVTHSTTSFQWTDIDATTPAAIRQLANNDEMVEALTESNQWTKRRQLVYVDPAFTGQAESIYDGSRKKITLPGFDGEEFSVMIDRDGVTDMGEAVTGSFLGTIPDREGAEVVAGSDADFWSIGIQFADTHYQIENREHGEWIISEIDIGAMNSHFGACAVQRGVDDVGPVLTAQ